MLLTFIFTHSIFDKIKSCEFRCYTGVHSPGKPLLTSLLTQSRFYFQANILHFSHSGLLINSQERATLMHDKFTVNAKGLYRPACSLLKRNDATDSLWGGRIQMFIRGEDAKSVGGIHGPCGMNHTQVTKLMLLFLFTKSKNINVFKRARLMRLVYLMDHFLFQRCLKLWFKSSSVSELDPGWNLMKEKEKHFLCSLH